MQDTKVTLPALKAKAQAGEKIVMLTAYDFPSARLADAAGVDVILVGDSAAMVMLGYDSTLPVTVEEMAVFTAAVARGATRALIVADLPFGSYQVSDEEALRSAVALMKAGADAVKLEGAGLMLDRVKALTGAGIAVVGHVGLTPQSATALGGYRAQGKDAAAGRRLVQEARALEAAGCFAIVFEAVPPAVAKQATAVLSVPTIGIGAGADTDGQVLVWHDLLGLGDFKPRFVKHYADLEGEISRALAAYVTEVRSGTFPAKEHTYSMPAEEEAELESRFAARRQGNNNL